MSAKVALTIIKGAPKGKKYVFAERTTSVVGRGSQCYPRLPTDDDHKGISRHHCLLDINPPDIAIRDFGSKNGTRVNGEKIGQRARGFSAKDVEGISLPERKLCHGDEIKIGNVVFRVSVSFPPKCARCGSPIPAFRKKALRTGRNQYLCDLCRCKTTVQPKPETSNCPNCGREMDADTGHGAGEDRLCAKCIENPSKLGEYLVSMADEGKRNLPVIQGFSIVKHLGQGGMGAVSLALDKKTGAEVALKVMAPQTAGDKGARELFLREVENTKSLSHPNVVKLFDYGYSDGIYFFTMEYCDGGAVDSLMKKRGGKLPVEEALEITLQGLDGLEYAHNAAIPNVKLADGKYVKGKGLVHRDLKPHNIFLKKSGGGFVAKIADFGLSKAFDMAGLSGQTAIGMISGSPAFTSRQQALKFKYAKPAVDVWAMAASLYFMLTGKYVRNFSKGQDFWKVILEQKPVPILRRGRKLPEKLAEVIDHALIEQPKLTFKSAADFKKALVAAM